uniref:Uncharacterized protein n=1 Tax=Ciona savignyi TaxID=51511 RepID=H2YHP5_CIOSA
MVIWSSATGIFMNIWRVMLIVGMGTAALNMLGALVLLVASCIWGQKEHYIRMRNAAIIWVSTTTVALVYNLGEAVYVSVIPYKVPIPPIEGDEYNLLSRGNHHHYSKIKKNMATVWGLTATHLFFYIYLIIVVISYLRLLKYKGAPKVGKDMAGSDSEEEVVGVLQRSKNSSFSQQSVRSRTSDRQSEQSFASSNDLSRSSYTNPAFLPNNTYMNWPKNNDDTKSDITNLPTRATPIDSRSATSSVYDLP